MLRGLGMEVVAVGGGGLGTALVRSLSLPYPVLVDKEHRVYRSYGLSKALHILQESATFLVAKDGTVRHAMRSLNPRASLNWTSLMADVRALSVAEGGDESANAGEGR